MQPKELDGLGYTKFDALIYYIASYFQGGNFSWIGLFQLFEGEIFKKHQEHLVILVNIMRVEFQLIRKIHENFLSWKTRYTVAMY